MSPYPFLNYLSANAHKTSMSFRFLDLFAGAGGLSEGFIQAGYTPVAHVEMDKAACNTLRTRAVFHELDKSDEGRKVYCDYLRGKIDRNQLYGQVAASVTDSVIQQAIGADTIDAIFNHIDRLNDNKSIDIVIGGPPCQAYSVVGRSRVGEKMKDDSRNYLFEYYVEFLKKYQPKFFVFENVTGLYSAKDKEGNRYYDKVRNALESAGYHLSERVYKTEDYGLPQKRRRVIIIGTRFDLPVPTIMIQQNDESPKIKDILGDLKRIQGGEGDIRSNGRAQGRKVDKWLVENHIADKIYPVTFHQSRPVNEHDKDIYRRVVEAWEDGQRRFNYATDLPADMQTHKNIRSFTDRFKVVDGESTSSQTVVAHISKDGHYYIHYDKEQNRSLTPREAARLQTFPDNYFFESATTKDGRAAAFRQIGNAVPVMLARKIAESLLPFISDTVD